MRTSCSRAFSAFLLLVCCAAPLVAQSAAYDQNPDPCSAFSLTPDPAYVFDVAAIKPGDPSEKMPQIGANQYGRWDVEDIDIGHLIEDAYGVASYQVEGLPKVLRDQLYDIHAKTLHALDGGPVTKYDRNEQKRMQALLADRFGLKLSCRVGQHKTAILYRDPKHAAPAVSTVTGKGSGWRNGHGAVSGKGAPFRAVVDAAAWTLQEKVEDDTALTGIYNFDMHWTPIGEESNDPDAKSFEEVLYETFGVRVKHEMRPIAILVVEQAHAPQFD
ncbi:TIGR03435 family protein [Silvibacterium sp.]|uniref:TIGR03435 family protein n=1 Tax=Silvibacterium sp. TaxID=1964179 RepID=UPI0039E4F36F